MDQVISFCFFFFFNDTATTEIYTLSLHDALPISHRGGREGLAQDRVAGRSAPHLRVPGSGRRDAVRAQADRRPTALRSEEHTSELQSLAYLVCRLLLEKKKIEYYEGCLLLTTYVS